ncbi:hypothetical protein RJ640_002705 [Escallonia rubra]|uniref:Uncharacterized protein n=1 Tax=Escallonia rubra TaxID=112253 RepID=A0AA88R058_9ASTE|nr:hypothetical protein RJ640_002705 [Escallonia rubra]
MLTNYNLQVNSGGVGWTLEQRPEQQTVSSDRESRKGHATIGARLSAAATGKASKRRPVCNMLVSVHYFWKDCGDSRRRNNVMRCKWDDICINNAFHWLWMLLLLTLLEEPCADCLVHCCCHKCALRQEYRELQHQGFDMSLGKIHFFPSS